VTRAYIAGEKSYSDLIDGLREELAATQSGRVGDIQDRDRVIAEHCKERDRLAEELSRRASFRWWLALPWRRLARALKGLPPGG
jgi:hypothetical protein